MIASPKRHSNLLCCAPPDQMVQTGENCKVIHANEKALDACNTEGFETDTHKADFATGRQNSKVISTQIAELALAGHAVQKLRCGDFLVSKWGYCHYAQDFEALQAFARKLGVTK